MFRRRIEYWKDAAATRGARDASNSLRLAIHVVTQEFWLSLSASIGWAFDSGCLRHWA
jgi:hypothetical protein